MGWIGLALLIVTGLIQMSANPNYEGFLAVTNGWAVAIFIKHIVFLGMAALSAYNTWGAIPNLRRAELLISRGKAATDIAALQGRSLLLLRLNLVLGVVVLALTALARAAA